MRGWARTLDLGEFRTMDYRCALEDLGDCGEVDLDGGFGEASPSHSSKAVATLPSSQDLLDPAPNAVDRLVPDKDRSKTWCRQVC